MTRQRTIAAIHRDIESDLMAFAFEKGPVFRMGFDHHVRRWQKAKQSQLWQHYWANPEFRHFYDAEVDLRRRWPMPPMKPAIALSSGENNHVG